METLMSEALQTFNHPTCETTPNATSSLASEVGASPCSLPDGPQKDLFGQALAPASHSAPQEKAGDSASNLRAAAGYLESFPKSRRSSSKQALKP